MQQQPRTVFAADPSRDAALCAHRFTCGRDLFRFTDYMLDVGEAVRAAGDVCDVPDCVRLSPVTNLYRFLRDVGVTSRNLHLVLDLSRRPFRDLAWDLVEGYVTDERHVHARIPFFSWLWEDCVVPRLYHLLSASWPETRLGRPQLDYLVRGLRDAIHRHPWPSELTDAAEECGVCMRPCVTEKFRMVCGHWCCHFCQMEWLRRSNKCPFCRQLVFYDLYNDL